MQGIAIEAGNGWNVRRDYKRINFTKTIGLDIVKDSYDLDLLPRPSKSDKKKV